MYYRDSELNLYRIISEDSIFFICEGLKGANTGRIVYFNKKTGRINL